MINIVQFGSDRSLRVSVTRILIVFLLLSVAVSMIQDVNICASFQFWKDY